MLIPGISTLASGNVSIISANNKLHIVNRLLRDKLLSAVRFRTLPRKSGQSIYGIREGIVWALCMAPVNKRKPAWICPGWLNQSTTNASNYRNFDFGGSLSLSLFLSFFSEGGLLLSFRDSAGLLSLCGADCVGRLSRWGGGSAGLASGRGAGSVRVCGDGADS